MLFDDDDDEDVVVDDTFAFCVYRIRCIYRILYTTGARSLKDQARQSRLRSYNIQHTYHHLKEKKAYGLTYTPRQVMLKARPAATKHLLHTMVISFTAAILSLKSSVKERGI